MGLGVAGFGLGVGPVRRLGRTLTTRAGGGFGVGKAAAVGSGAGVGNGDTSPFSAASSISGDADADDVISRAPISALLRPPQGTEPFNQRSQHQPQHDKGSAS